MYLQIGEGAEKFFLRVIDMTRFDRDAVWSPDGTTLIGVDTILGWNCTFAPGGYPRLDSATALSPDTVAHLVGSDATEAVLRANPRGANPGATERVVTPPSMELDVPGSSPVPANLERSGPETDAELQRRLWLPRQKIILWVYDKQTGRPIRWLESPRPGFTQDAANGPIPLSVDVVSVAGEPLSTAIHFQIQTRMSPCPTGSDRLVLSHRWQMTHGHDADNYLTRTIEGQVVFHGGVLAHLGIQPDSIRRQFIHPIPLGMRRTPPTVTQSPDGLTIRYTVVDTDPTIMFDAGDSGATNVLIAEKAVWQHPTTWNGDPHSGRD